MTKAEAIEELRRRLDDEAPPYLWDDPLLVSYLAQAEEEAADRAKLIIDETTPSLTKITVKAGVPSYKLAPRVIGVKTVILESDGRELDRTTEDELRQESSRWRTITGHPCRFFEDELGRSITLFAKPNADDIARLIVYRLPVEPLKDRTCFEIPEAAHMRMLDWALRLAYLKRDSDTFSPEKAAAHEELFTRSFGIREDFNVQRKQRRHAPPVVQAEW